MPIYHVKKKNKAPIVEIPEDNLVSLDEYAVILWHTSFLGYEFAHALNQLFELELSRQDNDMPISQTVCPHYRYDTPSKTITYHLFENPFSQGGLHPLLANYDKILIINGSDAYSIQEEMDRIFGRNKAYADPQDPLQYQQQQLIDKTCQWVYEMHCIDLRTAEQVSTTLFSGTASCDNNLEKLRTFFVQVAWDLDLAESLYRTEPYQ